MLPYDNDFDIKISNLTYMYIRTRVIKHGVE